MSWATPERILSNREHQEEETARGLIQRGNDIVDEGLERWLGRYPKGPSGTRH